MTILKGSYCTQCRKYRPCDPGRHPTAVTADSPHGDDCQPDCPGGKTTISLAQVADEILGEPHALVINNWRKADGRTPPESKPDFCNGSVACAAGLHAHGCYADIDGSTCDDPEDHYPGWRACTPSAPSGGA